MTSTTIIPTELEVEEELSLPLDTLQILNEFLKEKADRERIEEENIQGKAGKDATFEENWQLSQFWYSEKTKADLSGLVKRLVDGDTKQTVALLSCPSLYKSTKSVHDNVKIFEFDSRFSAFGDDFVLYDFNEGENEDYLSAHSQQFDIIIADPPFLSEECISKISLIIKRLQKPNAKIIFCSGEVVEGWLKTHLGLEKRSYHPEHERNLGNEFVSYANFNLDEYL